jgi:GcrA cell cycle regulator
MSWTDDRIEKLKSLWAEGLSASQIANALGEVTRNAVIGKIHRLGLSGRVKGAIAPARPDRQRHEPEARPARAALAAPQPALRRALAIGNAVLKSEPEEDVAPVPVGEAAVIALHGGVSFADLGPCMCRWPQGDPSDGNFRFCGRPAQPGQPYCSEHAGRAFHNRVDRPRRPG